MNVHRMGTSWTFSSRPTGLDGHDLHAPRRRAQVEASTGIVRVVGQAVSNLAPGIQGWNTVYLVHPVELKKACSSDAFRNSDQYTFRGKVRLRHVFEVKHEAAQDRKDRCSANQARLGQGP